MLEPDEVFAWRGQRRVPLAGEHSTPGCLVGGFDEVDGDVQRVTSRRKSTSCSWGYISAKVSIMAAIERTCSVSVYSGTNRLAG